MRLAWAVCCVALWDAACAGAQERIPPLNGRTLSGTTVTLPARQAATVLVLGFAQSSRTDVTAWGKWLGQQYGDGDRVAWYEMPVVEGVPRFLRGWVLGRIRSSATPRGQAHLLPVEDREAAWRQAAGFGKAENAYVLVVDQRGQVLWRTSGAATPERAADLAHQVDAVAGAR